MPETAPIDRYVLEGRLVTMSSAGVVSDGAVFVEDGVIEAVLAADDPLPDPKYEQAPRIRTGDTIYPGLIELHNHLSYNAMPIWDVPQLYSNNGQWRGTPEYTREITKPSQVLGQTPGAAQALVRYVECRALLGGVTTTQGISLASAGGIEKYYRGIVRNVESPGHPGLPLQRPRSPTRRWEAPRPTSTPSSPATPVISSISPKAPTRQPAVGFSAFASTTPLGRSMTCCAGSTAPPSVLRTSKCSPLPGPRWSGRR